MLLTFFPMQHIIMLEISEHAYFYQGGSAMNGKFGEFIAEKRKSRGLTLRGLSLIHIL